MVNNSTTFLKSEKNLCETQIFPEKILENDFYKRFYYYLIKRVKRMNVLIYVFV